MSSLKWEVQARVIAGTNGRVLTSYWELWDQKPREWYHSPFAIIERLGPRLYELDVAPDDYIPDEKRKFTTLKAAKAMGIALTKLKD